MSGLTYRSTNDLWCIFLTSRELKQYAHGASYVAMRRKSGATWSQQRYATPIPQFHEREDQPSGPKYIRNVLKTVNNYNIIVPCLASKAEDISFEEYSVIRLYLINRYAFYLSIRILHG